MNTEPITLPKPFRQAIFDYFAQNHGLALLESEMADIELVVNKELCWRLQTLHYELIVDHNKLLGFAGKILRLHRGDHPSDIGDIDGGTLEEAALEFGLLESRMVSEPCCEDCQCAGRAAPWECYFQSKLGDRAAAARQEPRPTQQQ